MKKKLIFVMMLLIGFCSIGYSQNYVYAEGSETYVDYSFLNTDEALIGHMQIQPMGIYLLDGTSTITKNSTLSIGAGGSTTATEKCRVSVLVIVEQLDDGVWGYWHSWKVTEEDAYSAVAGKTLAVARGYSYRVRCTHYAESDVSSSWTGALRM